MAVMAVIAVKEYECNVNKFLNRLICAGEYVKIMGLVITQPSPITEVKL